MDIISNGSKWNGQAPDPIENLIAVLATETLDPRFEQGSDFITIENGQVHAFGDFLSVAHVFNIRGTTKEMQPLVDAIRQAQQKPEYLAHLKANVAEVIIHKGEPENGNPYRGHGLMGEARSNILICFHDGLSVKGYTLWHCSPRHPARRLTSPDQIDWASAGL